MKIKKANFELISQKIENALNIYSISKVEFIIFNKKRFFRIIFKKSFE
jgi:hypothetical protein